MKIIQLTAENVKKLKVVDITPSDGLNQITGKNGSGKTSVLDSIWWALAGSKGIQAVPIRTGAESARIRLDLGDLIVNRKFLPSGTTSLTVLNAAGAAPGTPDKKLPVWGSPQEILDALVGSLSFDPLAFANKKGKDQYDELKAVAEVSVDIEALEAQNDSDFKKRTDVNRDAKAKHAQAEAIAVDPSLPVQPVSETDLLNEMQTAAEHNAAIETRKARREQARRDAEDKKAEGVRLRNRASEQREQAKVRSAELRKQLAAFEKDAEARAKALDDEASTVLDVAATLEKKIDGAEPLPASIDVSTIRAALDAAKVTNAGIVRREQRNALLKEAGALESQSAELTKRIEDREKQKADAIANAKMPIPGLSLSNGRVWLKGLPFDQASDAERLRTSVAIAMAANPKLRVLRIKDGSLLDEDGVRMIEELATAKDYQIWMERVDSSGKIGIVMENGEVVADNRAASTEA